MASLLEPLDTQREKVPCRNYALFVFTGKSCLSFTSVLWLFLLSMEMMVSLLCLLRGDLVMDS